MIGLFMWVLLCTRERTAMAEGPPGEAPPRHVEIKLVAKAEDRSLVAVLSELLERLQVSTHFQTVADLESEEMWNHPGAPAAVARAWIDLRENKQVTLYLTGDRQDRVLVRQVPLVTRLDEVAREEIAHIVEAAVDELLLGGQIGVEKKGPELPPPVQLPPPLPEPPLRLDVGFGYAAQAWKDAAPLHGPAGFVSLAKKRGPWRPGAWLSVEMRFPETVKKDDITLSLDQGAVRLLFVADHTFSNRWNARFGVGGGLDLVHFKPEINQAGNIARNESTRFVPMLRALALARYAFAGRSELFFGLAADADVTRGRYTAVTKTDGDPSPPVTDTVFHPWAIRPMALIGITADVLAY
ncbi:MAG: hypothetical protein ABW133_02805 [Polyangiaceae bacterium]